MKSLVLIVALLSSFLAGSLMVVEPVYGEGYIENKKEFVDNVIFEKTYLDLPTWKKSYTKNLGDAKGKLKATVYASLGRAYIRLPTKIRARYDTVLEPFGGPNVVEMAVDPYNGDGLEAEFVFGLNVSVEYDPIGPGKLSAGDFDTGVNFEGDFTPPLQGQSVVTSSESFTASIGLYKLLSLVIGIDTRFRIHGRKIIGAFYEDDSRAVAHDVGSTGVVLKGGTYTPQFSIDDPYWYLALFDCYIDFGVYNSFYVVDYEVEVAPVIGFEFLGVSWTWTLPLWLPIPLFTEYIPVNAGKSDDMAYQMSRLCIPGVGSAPPAAAAANGNGLPIFDIGPSPPLSAAPNETLDVTLPIQHAVYNPPPGYVADTALKIYYQNGTLAKSIPVDEMDFANEEISTTIIMPPMLEAGDEYHNFKFSLIVPDLFPWYGSICCPPSSAYATVAVNYRRPDLNIVQETLGISSPVSQVHNAFYHSLASTITATVSNDGGLPSTPTIVNLWLHEGLPSVPAYGDITILIAASYLIGSQPLSSLAPRPLPGFNQTLVFPYLVPPSMENKTVAFILEVVQPPMAFEISEENNVAFTTADIMATNTGMRWTYTLTNSSFRSLDFTFGTPTGSLVSDLAEAAAMNEPAYTDPETFITTMESLAQAESLVDEELLGFVPDELLIQYEVSVTQLTVAINEAIANGNYTQLKILEVIGLQLEVVDVVDEMWSGSVSGLVIDDSTGKGLSGVEINVSGNTITPFVSTQTHENGSFTIPLLYQGSYTLNASKFGYQNISQPIIINPATTTDVFINLVSITGILEINVTDEISDEPINAAIVTVTGKQAFREDFESGTFEGWDFYYSTDGAQSGSVPPGTWNSSIVSGASSLSGTYSARLFADSDAWAAPWRVDAAINQTINRAGANILGATLKFDNIQGSGGVGLSYFLIIVHNALDTSKRVSYGFSTTGDYGDIKYTVSPGDLVYFERNIAVDYSDKYGESLPDEVITRFQASADYAEGLGERRTTEVRIDNIYIVSPFVKRGVTTNGYVSFSELLPGNHTIVVEKENYVPAEKNSTVYSQTTTSIQIVLSPSQIHDVAIVGISYPYYLVPEGHAIDITLKVGNEGMWNETFDVTAYANATIIATQLVTLTRRNFTTIIFTWNTNGFAKGYYTIRAYAEPVPGEIDTADNTLIDGMLRVGVHDVAVIDITAFPTSVPQGEPVYIDVTVENQGNFTETFDVNVSARHWGTGTVIHIGTQTVYDLQPGVSEILNFVWDTTGAPVGTYDVIAEAILPEDDDPEDNILIAKGIVAGITVPYQNPQTNLLAYLVQIAAMILAMVALGVAAIGFFKILGSERPRWSWRSLKKTSLHASWQPR